MPQKPKYKLKNLAIDGKTIGERIASIRKAKGLSQAKLAEKIGINQTLVSDYEINRLRIPGEMLIHFAIALGVTTDEILGLKDSTHLKYSQSLRIMRRMVEIQKLPEYNLKAILRTIDELIKAAKS